MKTLKRFLTDEKGQGLTEYAMVLALVAAAIVAVSAIFSDEIKDFFQNVFEKLGEILSDD